MELEKAIKYMKRKKYGKSFHSFASSEAVSRFTLCLTGNLIVLLQFVFFFSVLSNMQREEALQRYWYGCTNLIRSISSLFSENRLITIERFSGQ